MQLDILEQITSAGKKDKANEDMIVIENNYYMILDGATGLGKQNIPNYQSDALWFVREFTKYFKENLFKFTITEDIIFNTLKDIETIYLKNILDLPFQKYNYPSAGMILAHKHKADSIDFYRLGDCEAFVKSNNKSKKIFNSSYLNELDSYSINKMQKYIKAGFSTKEARRRIMHILQSNRNKMNVENGYWVLSIVKSDIQNIIQHIEKIIVPIECNDVILLASDGYSALTDKYNKDIFQFTLKDGLNIIRDIENSDSNLIKYPRLKKSDDATALLLKYSCFVNRV